MLSQEQVPAPRGRLFLSQRHRTKGCNPCPLDQRGREHHEHLRRTSATPCQGGDATLTANFERMLEVRVWWLPPVTNKGFVLQAGSTLPLKFQLVEGNEAVVTEVQEGIPLED